MSKVDEARAFLAEQGLTEPTENHIAGVLSEIARVDLVGLWGTHGAEELILDQRYRAQLEEELTAYGWTLEEMWLAGLTTNEEAAR